MNVSNRWQRKALRIAHPVYYRRPYRQTPLVILTACHWINDMKELELLRRAEKVLVRMRDLHPANDELREVTNAIAWHVRTTPEETIEFELAGAKCLVNGRVVSCRSKGLALAWLVLASDHHQVGNIRAEWAFPGPAAGRCAVQALDRAADAVRMYPALASAIAGIGVRRGELVPLHSVQGIVFTSQRLVEIVQGVTSA